MKVFFKKLIVAFIFVGISYGVLIFVFVQTNTVDRFYPKISGPEVDGIILGSSRGFYGLNPDKVFEGLLVNRQKINFAFTMSTSPFGKVYFDAIKKKVNPKVKDGIFILEVSPLSLSVKNSSITNPMDFRETRLMLNHIKNLSGHPNLEYIFQIYAGSNVSGKMAFQKLNDGKRSTQASFY